MKILMNEKGYSLILTMLIFLLFTVLSVSVLTVALSGVKRNQTSEDYVQARELANKGIEHITNQIQSDLKNELGEEGITRSEFITKLNTILNRYKDVINSVHNTGATGEYRVYIRNIENVIENGEENPLKKKITFLSRGFVDGKEKTVISEVEIGAQSVLETLHYALGANKLCKTPNACIPGEGNMFLHGGVSITGDMKVDGNLIITNRGYAYLSGEKWIASVYPSILPTQGKANANLLLGGNIFTFNHTPPYEQHITTSNFGSSYTKLTDRIDDAFYNRQAPVIVKRQPIRDDIQIPAQKSVFYYKHNSPGVTIIKANNRIISNQNRPNDKVYASHDECFFIWCNEKYDGDYTFTGNNLFKSFATAGSLTIRNSDNQFKQTTFKEGAYIEKNLTIGNGSNSYNPNNYDKIRVDGPIFVNGDLTIKGADAEFNSIMYVMGDVTIEYSRINGLGQNGSLIIFANGNINIRNNSVNQDEPSNIKGFFYSEQALEMFGVGSNIRIEGGISARRIVLNAIRGRASNRYFEGAQRITNNDYFEGAQNQIGKLSRLQIIYDPEIINTYADIKSREPVIKNLDPPKIINRDIE